MLACRFTTMCALHKADSNELMAGHSGPRPPGTQVKCTRPAATHAQMGAPVVERQGFGDVRGALIAQVFCAEVGAGAVAQLIHHHVQAAHRLLLQLLRLHGLPTRRRIDINPETWALGTVVHRYIVTARPPIDSSCSCFISMVSSCPKGRQKTLILGHLELLLIAHCNSQAAHRLLSQQLLRLHGLRPQHSHLEDAHTCQTPFKGLPLSMPFPAQSSSQAVLQLLCMPLEATRIACKAQLNTRTVDQVAQRM